MAVFVTLLYGDSQSRLLNANCACRNFIDYVKEVCNFDVEASIDLCDENGTLFNIPSKPAMENLTGCLTHRGTYLPVQMETKLGFNEKILKNCVPLLNEWQKKYPNLEKKLKNQIDKGKKPDESPPKVNKKDKIQGSSAEIPKRASSNKFAKKK